MPKIPIEETIANLLKLGNSPNKEEAEAAVAKAAVLMAKYNVTEDMLDPHLRDEALGQVTSLSTMVTAHDSMRKSLWLHLLVSGIAQATYTKVLVSLRQATFVGRDSNVRMAIQMFNYLYESLHQEVEFLKLQYIRDFKETYGVAPAKIGGSNHPQTWRKSWLEGAATAIARRLYDEVKSTTEQEKETSSAIMVVSKTEIDKYVKDHFRTNGSARARKRRVNYSAHEDGIEYGRQANLGREGRLKTG